MIEIEEQMKKFFSQRYNGSVFRLFFHYSR